MKTETVRYLNHIRKAPYTWLFEMGCILRSLIGVGQIFIASVRTIMHPFSIFFMVHDVDSWRHIGVSKLVSQTNLVTRLVNPSSGKHCRYRGLPLRKHSSTSRSLNSGISYIHISFRQRAQCTKLFMCKNKAKEIFLLCVSIS